MFEIGDRVLVTEDYQGNNTKGQEGTVIRSYEANTVTILFDNKLNRGHDGGLTDKRILMGKLNQCWSVEIEFVQKIDTMKGEY